MIVNLRLPRTTKQDTALKDQKRKKKCYRQNEDNGFCLTGLLIPGLETVFDNPNFSKIYVFFNKIAIFTDFSSMFPLIWR